VRTPISDPPDPPRRSSKKNTRRWCRGKVGREHVRRWTIKPGIITYNIEACSECDREFRYCFGPLQRGGCICGSCEKERQQTVAPDGVSHGAAQS
jgi:hypothetical protein